MTEEEYRAAAGARADLTAQLLKVTEQSVAIPSQEENDLLALQLMNVDDKANPTVPEMPPLEDQQKYIQDAIDAASPPTEATAAPSVIDVPHVSGNGAVGETLSCTMGNWSNEPTSYAYKWLSDGVTEVGTDDSYVVADTDVGHSLACVVTATNAIGSTAAPASNATAVNGASRSRHASEDSSHTPRQRR